MMYIFYEKLKIFFHNYGLQFLTQKSLQKCRMFSNRDCQVILFRF